MTVHTAPSTISRPPTTHIEKSIWAPGTSVSTTRNGSSHTTTIASRRPCRRRGPDTRSARRIGTMPTATSDSPSRNGIACAELRPLDHRAARRRERPRRRRASPGAHGARGGSGRSRTAVTMFRTLTRHAGERARRGTSRARRACRRRRCSATSPCRRCRCSTRCANALADPGDHRERDADAEQRAERGRDEVVGRALEEEGLHEVAALRADRRATPISVRRSAASITKIRKISRMPAAIEKLPNVREHRA